jgi:hypothetical protein
MLRKSNIRGPAMQITRRNRAKVDARILGDFLYGRFHGPQREAPADLAWSTRASRVRGSIGASKLRPPWHALEPPFPSVIVHDLTT